MTQTEMVEDYALLHGAIFRGESLGMETLTHLLVSYGDRPGLIGPPGRWSELLNNIYVEMSREYGHDFAWGVKLAAAVCHGDN